MILRTPTRLFPGFATLLGISAAVLIFTSGNSTPVKSAPSPAVLWSADMETGDLSQWSLPDLSGGPESGGGVFNSGNAQAVVSSTAHTGRYSAKLAIGTNSRRTSGTRLFRWREPQTYSQLYYCAWFYFPQRYTAKGSPSWWNVFQWKSKHSHGIDPFFSLNVGNRPDGSMFFYLYDQNTKTSFTQSLATIPEKKWLRIEAFYSCSPGKSGRVSFWQDGILIFDLNNVQTRYADGDCQWSVNNYSRQLDPSHSVIYIDDAAICLGARCP